MIFRILKKEFRRNKAVNITIFLFILLSALLISGATSTIYTLVGSVDNFFEKAKAPDFTQSHVGDIKQSEIDVFSEDNSYAKEQQIVEMINIDGTTLYINDEYESESASAMDVSFVKQNLKFDFILNMNNEPAKVDDGEIAVPLYYMEQKDLEVGDNVWVKTDKIKKKFRISEFTRDAQMNPSLINSKRFVISDNDFSELMVNTTEKELLIEFLLTDTDKLNEFTNQYVDAKLPSGGYTIDQSILKLFNALSDVMIVAIIIFISILLIVIALLCLRFTLLSTIEEEYREIGVMKAIGISLKNIRRIYVVKYMAISFVACILGYILSLFVSNIFTSNIALYMGLRDVTAVNYIIPIIGALLIFGLVILSCRIILRKFKKISSVDAIRSGRRADYDKAHTRIKVSKTRIKNMNIFLGMRDVLIRYRSYLLLLIVIIICTFIMILPMNLATTMASPDFVSYMGAPKCDIRLDLQRTDDIESRYKKMIETLEKDKDVKKFSPLITCNYKILNDDGEYENMSVESGDLNKFPLEYVEGKAPKEENQIALSYAKSNDLKKSTGDMVVILYKGEERTLKISGIYQDITNGGKTAKVTLPYDAASVLWYTACIDINDGVNKENKISQFMREQSPAKVTDSEDYLSQTLGVMMERLDEIMIFSSIISVFILLLITALFINMLITKDLGDIAILNSFGYSFRNIRLQYVVRAVFTAVMGTILGIIMTMTLGVGLVGLVGSLAGIASFKFITNPILIYVIVPIIIIATVIITTLCVNRRINNKFSIKEIIE